MYTHVQRCWSGPGVNCMIVRPILPQMVGKSSSLPHVYFCSSRPGHIGSGVRQSAICHAHPLTLTHSVSDPHLQVLGQLVAEIDAESIGDHHVQQYLVPPALCMRASV